MKCNEIFIIHLYLKNTCKVEVLFPRTLKEFSSTLCLIGDKYMYIENLKHFLFTCVSQTHAAITIDPPPPPPSLTVWYLTFCLLPAGVEH